MPLVERDRWAGWHICRALGPETAGRARLLLRLRLRRSAILGVEVRVCPRIKWSHA